MEMSEGTHLAGFAELAYEQHQGLLSILLELKGVVRFQ
jgi:hypothetical protein